MTCELVAFLRYVVFGDAATVLSNLNDKSETIKMSEQLPRAFDSKYLK